jgi:hypothetical protein
MQANQFILHFVKRRTGLTSPIPRNNFDRMKVATQNNECCFVATNSALCPYELLKKMQHLYQMIGEH